MDWEFLLAAAFIGFGILAAVLGVDAAYHYVRFERQSDAPRVPSAIILLALQFALFFALPFVRREALLPTIFTATILLASSFIIWLGVQSQSRGGRRIAVAGILTLAAFCLYIYLVHRRR